MKHRKSLLLLMMLTLPGTRSATAEDTMKVDSEWQRVNLESTVNERARGVVSAFTQGSSFIVQTRITLKQDSASQPAMLSKLDPATGQKSAENEVVLSKLDIGAPTFEKLMASESLDSIFFRIQNVSIAASVPKYVLEASKDKIEKQLMEIGKLTSKVQVNVTVDELVAPRASKDDVGMAERIKNSIGTLAGAGLLGLFLAFFGWRALSAYRQFETKKLSIMEAANALEVQKSKPILDELNEVEHDEEVVTDSRDPYETEKLVEIEGADTGYERFKKLMATDSDSASGLVRQWITSPEKNGPFEALLSLPQFMDPSLLKTLFSYLTLSERRSWKSILNERVSGPTGPEAKLADAFITRQVLETIMMPAPIADAELKQLLQTLTFKDCFTLLSEDQNLAPVLINFLPTAIVSRIYALLPQEQADQITLMSVKLKEEEIRGKFETLKKKVKDLASGRIVISGTPFVENISELLRNVSGEKEKSIWNALIEAKEINVIRAASVKVFPAHLLVKMKPFVLKQAIDRFNTVKKAEFIFIKSDQDRKFYLEICGKEGSKIRDLIEYEIAQIENNDIRKQKVMKQAGHLQREFLDIVRKLVVSDDAIHQSAAEIVNQWIEQVIPDESYAKAA